MIDFEHVVSPSLLSTFSRVRPSTVFACEKKFSATMSLIESDEKNYKNKDSICILHFMNLLQNKKDFQPFFVFHKYKKTHLQRSKKIWIREEPF